MRRTILLALMAVMLVACGKSQVIRESGSGPVSPSAPAGSSTPVQGATVTVVRGDTLYRIARNHGISALDLAMWNGISAPYTIYPGQRLRLYPGSGAPGTAGTASRPATTSSRPATGASTPATQSSAAAAAAQSAPRSNLSWRWPTAGQVVAGFTAGDPTKQGISIAGTGGQAVQAASGGVVVYSGSGLVGYGELIIVKHDDNWLSAYGHNRSRLVAEGEQVRAGQQIAEMGRTGSNRDALHFEIRYQGRPVDPLQYLPSR